MAFIFYNEPTEQQIRKAVDMKFEKPFNPRKWIHEDIILVNDYLIDAKNPSCTQIAHHENIYCDQTDQPIHEILHKHANVPLRYV